MPALAPQLGVISLLLAYLAAVFAPLAALGDHAVAGRMRALLSVSHGDLLTSQAYAFAAGAQARRHEGSKHVGYNREMPPWARRLATAAVVCAAVSASLLVRAQPAASNLPTVLVSRQLLEAQQLAVGDVVTLSPHADGSEPRQFRIVGEYEPTPDPLRLGSRRHELRMHLPDLIAMTNVADDPQDGDSVDAINVALPNPSDARMFARDLSARLPGVVVRSTTGDDQRAAPFIVLERFHLAIAIVTVIASSIFLLALMLMLVDERRETTGILRLIGFQRRRILVFVLAEGLVLAAAGAVVGIALAAAMQGGINRFFQWRYDTALIFVRVTPRIALRSIAMSVPLGVLASVAASWTLLRREALSLTRR
jgi:putative ABC transport system permease protein